jgi:hypothetical protein
MEEITITLLRNYKKSYSVIFIFFQNARYKKKGKQQKKTTDKTICSFSMHHRCQHRNGGDDDGAESNANVSEVSNSSNAGNFPGDPFLKLMPINRQALLFCKELIN